MHKNSQKIMLRATLFITMFLPTTNMLDASPLPPSPKCEIGGVIEEITTSPRKINKQYQDLGICDKYSPEEEHLTIKILYHKNTSDDHDDTCANLYPTETSVEATNWTKADFRDGVSIEGTLEYLGDECFKGIFLTEGGYLKPDDPIVRESLIDALVTFLLNLFR